MTHNTYIHLSKWRLHAMAFLIAILSTVFYLAPAVAAPDDPQEATQTVEKKLAELLQLLKETKLPKDRGEAEKKVAELVDTNLDTIVDFQRIVKRVMGKHFASATKVQRNEFLDVFKSSLVRSYSKFLLTADLQELAERIRYKVQPAPKSKRKGRAQVTVVFKVDDQSYEVVNSMFYHTRKKAWFLENLVVAGINLGINYRTQFDRLMVKYKKDYDKVISEWAGQAQQNSTS